MPERALVVHIVGDSRSLERAFAKSTRSAQTFERRMSGLAKGAALAGAAAGATALGVAVRIAAEEIAASQKAAAQTNAVLRSTGLIAGVTAEDVDGLSQSLSQLSGVDDEAITSAQNLLLTFTRIGRAGGVFQQATTAALDMSVALGEDLQTATLRIGKALNDPIRGLTALRRVGVQFTDAQQRQITALAKSGRQMEAQKIILQELQTEFGGSAEAAGKTLPGQINKLRESFANLSGEIGTAGLPLITAFVDQLYRGIGGARRFAAAVAAIDFPEPPGAGQGFWGKIIGKTVDIAKYGQIWYDVFKLWEVGGNLAADALGNFASKTDQALAAMERIESHRAELGALQRGAQTGGGGGGRRRVDVGLRNRWFDAAIARQLNRLQDQSLRKQLEGLKRIAAEIRARMAVTKDATRRLNLEDQLLDITRQQRDVQAEITANIEAGNQALKDRAEAIKSAVIERLQARQTDILNKRALADAKEQLRLARALGGPMGIRAAQRTLADVRMDMLIARAQAAPASLTRGGMFSLGGVITININGITDPEAVARKVAEVLQRRGRHVGKQSRGPTAGSTAGQK